eukprot:m.75503 g.75503  ORF g.75503 m.75503 type:complete len:465 (+) comp9001_c0_seq1:69-1463(+)
MAFVSRAVIAGQRVVRGVTTGVTRLAVQPGAAAATTQVRWLNIHEFQAHALMNKYGITTPSSAVADSADDVARAASQFPGGCVVKAQVLAGGRGKGHFDNGLQGGVHVVNSADEAADMAKKMLGARLITKQTGAEGRPCSKVMLVEKVNIVKEFYLAILMDRAHNGPVVLASTEGGMDIEAVAATNPDAIVTLPINLQTGLTQEEAMGLADKLGMGDSRQAAAEQMVRLYQLFQENDATSIEINPLGLLDDGRVMFLDAKFNFDDNAEYRNKELFAMRDPTQENPLDVVAAEADLNYIGLDGTIGCLVNGAGLAMATMDIIKLHGGTPANFLDVGGGATTEQVQSAFELITSDPDVKCIFVNIFGGIMRCDVIAAGVISAARNLSLKIPVVVRLKGTRVEEAKVMLANTNLDLIACDDLDAAAKIAVSVADIVTIADNAGLDVSIKESPKFQEWLETNQILTAL